MGHRAGSRLAVPTAILPWAECLGHRAGSSLEVSPSCKFGSFRKLFGEAIPLFGKKSPTDLAMWDARKIV